MSADALGTLAGNVASRRDELFELDLELLGDERWQVVADTRRLLEQVDSALRRNSQAARMAGAA